MKVEEIIGHLEDLASSFEPISLEEMSSVKLMDRTDVKYILPLDILPAILQEARAQYRLTVIGDKRMPLYETLYYDTPDLSLYHMHQRGKKNRYKIRARNYVDSGIKFFEIKFKNNKGRTLKSRIESEEIDRRIEDLTAAFLSDSTPLDPASLHGIMWVDYKRITLVNKTTPERVTIDIGLTFRNDQKRKDFPWLVIAEIKQEKQKSSAFIDIMKKFRLQEGSVSKYCLGIISLFEGVKKNRFKPKLQRLKKITDTYDHFTKGAYRPASVV